MDELKPRFGCGALLPDVNGPTHPYLGASASCWAVYGEVLAREYGEYRYPPVHRQANLLAAGYRQHARSTWRKKRMEKTTPSIPCGDLDSLTIAAWQTHICGDDLIRRESITIMVEELRRELSGPEPSPLDGSGAVCPTRWRVGGKGRGFAPRRSDFACSAYWGWCAVALKRYRPTTSA
jgi:hypothetical protein